MDAAPYKKPRKQNVDGNFYVDESCIDCDVCRWMCPSVYDRKGLKSIVAKQPESDDERLQALAAMVSCPVGSIRTYAPEPLAKYAVDAFPAEIDSVNIPGVMHLGYHAEESFGATSYFIQRNGGNIMIDTPRFNSRLANAIEEEGGLRYIIMTHSDDIVDNEKWVKRFPGCERIIHKLDAMETALDSEIQIDGDGVWSPAEDFDILHTPGHTPGSLCVHYKVGVNHPGAESVLFTGDHVGYSHSRQGLDGFKRYCKGNDEVQAMTLEILANDEFDFRWILPGHGRMVRYGSVADKNKAILKCVEEFKAEDTTYGWFNIGYQ